MNRKGNSAKLLFFVVLLLLSIGFLANRLISKTESGEYKVFSSRVKFHLLKGLVYQHPMPQYGYIHSDKYPAIVYVLGSGQESLEYKFKTVGRLYKEGMIKEILVGITPGITEYSQKVGRNLTNDEWLVSGLEREGVASKDVEFTSLPPTLFGTFGEARTVSALAHSRRAKQLVLIASMHHTERVRLSFSHFNADNAFNVSIYGSEENAGINELLKESLKLRLYRYLIIPADRLFWTKLSPTANTIFHSAEVPVPRRGDPAH